MITGLTTGCFDLFHHTHQLYLERCRARCDKLVVGVDSNILVRATKGEKRPIYHQNHRFNLVANFSMVDAAFIVEELADITWLVRRFNVQKLFKCEKWADELFVYGVHDAGAELVIVRDLPDMVSTSEVIRRLVESHTHPDQEWVPID